MAVLLNNPYADTALIFHRNNIYGTVKGWACAISFLLYSILKAQSLKPVIFMTKEYSDMSLCMGKKIRLYT